MKPTEEIYPGRVGDPADSETPNLRRFRARILAMDAPVEQLSPLEQRLLAITQRLLLDCIALARCALLTGPGAAAPVTPAIVAEGARLALAAAIEIEDPLRTIRDRLERPQ